MNIVVVTEYFRRGGLETHLFGFLREVQRRGHRVSVIAGARERLEELRRCVNGDVLGMEWPQPPTGEAALDVAERMAGFCRARGADLLHLHPFSTLSYGCLAAARAGLPYVFTLHGPSNLRRPPAEGGALVVERIAAAASRVFCVCDEVTDDVREGAASDRVATLLNAVDLARWREAARHPSGPWAVVGRLDHDKVGSVRCALEALCAAPLAAEARVFGDGSGRAGLESWLAGQEWSARVRLQGHRDDLAEVLREGFAGVAGMTRVVLEAGALGLPVLLAGYDGVKGLIAVSDMAALARRNFSGRGLSPIDAGALHRQMALLGAEPERFQLRPWIEEHADQVRVWARYLQEVADPPAPRLGWPRAWLRAMEAAPDASIFAPEVLLRSIAEEQFAEMEVRVREREAAAAHAVAAASSRTAALEASEALRVAQALGRLRVRLAPPSSRRGRLLDWALGKMAGRRA